MLQQLQATAGQKVHERMYEPKFIWAGEEFPCTHSEILKNPPLMTGGFSPNTHVTVVVRRELFADKQVPSKGHPCTLKSAKGETFGLQITSTNTPIGDELWRFECVDIYQGA